MTQVSSNLTNIMRSNIILGVYHLSAHNISDLHKKIFFYKNACIKRYEVNFI